MNPFETKGLDDMVKKLNHLSTKYPYEAEELLTKVGNTFRKKVKQKTPDSGRQSKQKLMKSYRVSRVKGYGKDMWVEFRSDSPHFHLIERGHKVVLGGKRNKKDGGQSAKGTGRVVGEVPGVYMVERTSREFKDAFPKEVEKMVDKMIRKLG